MTPDDVIFDETGASWDEAVEAYLDAAIDSKNTRRAYRRHLKRAGVMLGAHSVQQLSGACLGAYRAEIVSSGLASASQAQALAALRSFLSWVGDLGGHRLPSRTISTALKAPSVGVVVRYNTVSEREIAALFAAVREPRERALLAVFLGSGLRVAEVSRLALADIIEDLDGEVALFVREGKGRKDRVVPIRPEVYAAIREYVASTGRYLSGQGPLFLAADRGAAGRMEGLGTRAVSRLVEAMVSAAGINAKKVTPHAFRHTYAIRCLRAGGNVVAVAKLLGHANIATTQRYLDHLATSELRSSVPGLPL